MSTNKILSVVTDSIFSVPALKVRFLNLHLGCLSRVSQASLLDHRHAQCRDKRWSVSKPCKCCGRLASSAGRSSLALMCHSLLEPTHFPHNLEIFTLLALLPFLALTPLNRATPIGLYNLSEHYQSSDICRCLGYVIGKTTFQIYCKVGVLHIKSLPT